MGAILAYTRAPFHESYQHWQVTCHSLTYFSKSLVLIGWEALVTDCYHGKVREWQLVSADNFHDIVPWLWGQFWYVMGKFLYIPGYGDNFDIYLVKGTIWYIPGYGDNLIYTSLWGRFKGQFQAESIMLWRKAEKSEKQIGESLNKIMLIEITIWIFEVVKNIAKSATLSTHARTPHTHTTYTHTHTHTHTYTHTRARTHTRTHTYACTHTPHTHPYTHTQTYTHTRIRTRTRPIHTYTDTYVHAHTFSGISCHMINTHAYTFFQIHNNKKYKHITLFQHESSK